MRAASPNKPETTATCTGCPAGIFPLSMATCDHCVRLVDISGSKKIRKRLAELGLNTGCELRVVQHHGGGPIILAVKDDARMALGRGMAHHIMVEASPDSTTEQ